MSIREHAEAILRVPRPGKGHIPEWNVAAQEVAAHAQAILDALDAADRGITGGLVTGGDTPAYTYSDYRIVPDPAGACRRGDAT